MKKKTKKGMLIFLSVIIILVAAKAVWVVCATSGHGSWDGEKKAIIRRANYLTAKVATSPQALLDEMPSAIGEQFQGEWALYSCSMTCAALANIAILYPQNKDMSIKYIGEVIDIAMSEEIREYDKLRWKEDPMDGIYGDLSHISYYSHLAWMISRYKQVGGDGKYDGLYHSLCKAMNRRIRQSQYLNCKTYPGELVYIPDMLVAIVALHNYSRQYKGEYDTTVRMWIERAKNEWLDEETGLLASFLDAENGITQIVKPVKGSYSALNIYYLSLIDPEFAKEQYDSFIKHFKKSFPAAGISEYHDSYTLLGMDIDAGPVVLNYSPSGTSFALGAATSLGDMLFRKKLLKTIEIGGNTLTWFSKSHYMVSDLAVVAEAILLAMRTSAPETRVTK